MCCPDVVAQVGRRLAIGSSITKRDDGIRYQAAGSSLRAAGQAGVLVIQSQVIISANRGKDWRMRRRIGERGSQSSIAFTQYLASHLPNLPTHQRTHQPPPASLHQVTSKVTRTHLSPDLLVSKDTKVLTVLAPSHSQLPLFEFPVPPRIGGSTLLFGSRFNFSHSTTLAGSASLRL